jgi:hypothetical protein
MKRLIIGTVFVAMILLLGCEKQKSSQHNINNRENFIQSIISLHQSMELTQPEDKSTEPFTIPVEREKQINSLIERGLALSRDVEDTFLDKLNPELKQYYREKLIKGALLYSQGIKESMEGNIMRAVQLQMQGNQLVAEWLIWWEKHEKEIGNKLSKSKGSFWGFFFRLLVGSIILPVVFSFLVAPLFGLLYLTMKKEETKMTVLSYPVLGLLFVAQLYFWGLWAAYCSSLVAIYSSSSEVTSKCFYLLIGFGFCASPIGWLAYKEQTTAESSTERKGIQKGASMYGLLAIVAYIVFSIWPRLMYLPYSWFLNWLY